jgi:hypothetical protein
MKNRLRAPLLAVLWIALAIAGCDAFRGLDVDCGPLDTTACQGAVEEIRYALLPQIQGRRIVLIELFNEAEALVTLDDGTPVGWNRDGRR